MNIADNKNQFLESLFKPIEGKTYDGYIEKVTRTGRKAGVHFWARNKEYTVTPRGVLASRSKDEKGQTWYSYTLGVFKSYSAECDFCSDMLHRFEIERIHG